MSFKNLAVLLFIFMMSGLRGQIVEPHFIDQTKVADTLAKGAQLYKISETESYIYGRPSFLSIVPSSLRDMRDYGKFAFKEENLWKIGAMAFVTGACVVYDQSIVDKAQNFGRTVGISGNDNKANISPIPHVPIWVPTDLPSSLYFIGDGWTEATINVGFYLYGFLKKDNRAYTTAVELTEGLIDMAVVTQTMKHIAGRQCPFTESQPGGIWHWFPNQITYANNVPYYDAFPSGHLATAMETVTIISENYPDYKFIKPLGYGLMAVCGYQMLNNGVHWFSDYPLAIALGYGMGKIAVTRGRLKVKNNKTDVGTFGDFWRKINITPVYSGNSYSMGLNYKF